MIVCMYVRTCECMYECICTCVCMYVCMCVLDDNRLRLGLRSTIRVSITDRLRVKISPMLVFQMTINVILLNS